MLRGVGGCRFATTNDPVMLTASEPERIQAALEFADQVLPGALVARRAWPAAFAICTRSS
mgnify:CR=1 FL=1